MSEYNLEVTQEDRDAVFAWQNASSHAPNKLAEAFARHRIAAIAAARPAILEAAAMVADSYEAALHPPKAWPELEREGYENGCLDTAQSIADAIRKLEQQT